MGRAHGQVRRFQADHGWKVCGQIRAALWTEPPSYLSNGPPTVAPRAPRCGAPPPEVGAWLLQASVTAAFLGTGGAPFSCVLSYFW